MKPNMDDPFDKDLSGLARRFEYPATPALAGRVRAALDAPGRRMVVSWKPLAVALLVILLVLFSVPPVRAGLVDFFQVGVVRIFRLLPATPPPAPKGSPSSLLNLGGRTTLEDARRQADFPILLPAYPAGTGQPDLVYYQRDIQMASLVWLDPTDTQKVRMSLYEIAPSSIIIKKMQPEVIQETSVNGQYALWTTGPYLVEINGGDLHSLRMVEGHALIWAIDEVTYRLETGIPLDQAIKIGESLR